MSPCVLLLFCALLSFPFQGLEKGLSAYFCLICTGIMYYDLCIPVSNSSFLALCLEYCSIFIQPLRSICSSSKKVSEFTSPSNLSLSLSLSLYIPKGPYSDLYSVYLLLHTPPQPALSSFDSLISFGYVNTKALTSTLSLGTKVSPFVLGCKNEACGASKGSSSSVNALFPTPSLSPHQVTQ